MRCNIIGVNINPVNMNEELECICKNIDNYQYGYVCVSNVHTTVMAYEDAYYREIQNSSFMSLPDGAPIAKICRRNGYKKCLRVAGPDLMEEIFKISEEKGYKHFFYGSTNDTLDKIKLNLTTRYPNLIISRVFPPPFSEIGEAEKQKIIDMINVVQPDIIWVGLGAPKQEIWMFENKNKIKSLMNGVGAGFDYHAGKIKRAPKIMQNLCLEWLYRLMQEPKILFKRYLVTNSKFIFYILKEKIAIGW